MMSTYIGDPLFSQRCRRNRFEWTRLNSQGLIKNEYEYPWLGFNIVVEKIYHVHYGRSID